MARMKIRHLVDKGGLHYWQPSSTLRRLGFSPRRLSDDATAAIVEAEQLNAEADAARGRALEAPAARRRARGPAHGSVAALIAAYRRSVYYRDLAPSTQRGYDQALEKLEAWAGPEPAGRITAGMVQTFYRDLRGRTPAFANAIVRVGRLLWAAGRRLDLVTGNPFERPALVGTEKSGRVWPREAIDAVVRAADALGRHSIGTAVVVNAWAGQREGDVLRLPRTLLDAGAVHLVQQKTGAAVRLPLADVPEVVARVAGELERLRARGVEATTLIVSEETGRPYTSDDFRAWFRRVRDVASTGDAELGLPSAPDFLVDYLVAGRKTDARDAYRVRLDELWFMHLRHTAVVRMAEAGVDLVAIAAVTGHSEATVQQVVRHYAVKTRALAAGAFRRRLAHETGSKGDAS
jgi:hypothetical protein